MNLIVYFLSELRTCTYCMSSIGICILNLLFLVEDLERNDGSEEKPYFMNKGLMKLLGKKNKKPDS